MALVQNNNIGCFQIPIPISHSVDLKAVFCDLRGVPYLLPIIFVPLRYLIIPVVVKPVVCLLNVTFFFYFSGQRPGTDQSGGYGHPAAAPGPAASRPALSTSFTPTSCELWRAILVYKRWCWQLFEELEGYLFESYADSSTVSIRNYQL